MRTTKNYSGSLNDSQWAPETDTMFVGRLIKPYQDEGVRWMTARDKEGGGFLCDEMGLGKTAQTIAMMCNNPGRTLVVAPKSVTAQWNKELTRFAPTLKGVTITSYTALLSKKSQGLCLTQWDRVVLDEAHHVRNPKSKSFVEVMRLRSKSTWLITGTPVVNSLKDFATLYGLIHRGNLVNRDKTKEFLNDLKLSVQQELEKIRDKYVLRRTKEQVAQHCERLRLPSCHSGCMEVPMTLEEEQTYFEVYNKFKDSIKDAQRRGASQREKNMKILEGMLRARQTMTNRDLVHEIMEGNFETGHLPSKVVQLLKDLATHPNEKAIIFCQFHGEMDAINQALGNRCYRLDGTLDAETRNFILNRFRNDPNPGAILISQIVVGGVGLNLQEATRVYLMSPQWNPAAEMQAIGRVHRTGQTKEVVTKRYVATVSDPDLPSIDLAMVSLQEKKAEDYGVITDKCFVPATRTERELSKTFFRR